MLKGRIVVVTGSTSGIGLGIARAFAAQGCHIVLNGFGDAAEIEALRAAMTRDFAVEVAYDGADLSQADDCRALVANAEKRFGAVDVLVNNAGIQHVSPVEDFPVERWDAVVALNQSAAFHTIRAAVPGMRKRAFGRLINNASAHGLVASPNKAAYVAAKHALVGLTKVVALECAATPITCNAICPGWVMTPLVQKQIDARAAADRVSPAEAARRLLAEKQPTGRFTTVEQLGGVAVFLASPAADNITGIALPVDGGWTAQ